MFTGGRQARPPAGCDADAAVACSDDYDYGPDGRSRAVALGAGRYDHEPPLRLLAEAGFDGYCSVEIIHGRGSAHDADGVLGQYADKLREYLARS